MCFRARSKMSYAATKPCAAFWLKGKLVGIITADDIVRVAPREIELLLELAAIKGGSGLGDETIGANMTEGECETCGNYSDRLKKTENDEYVCNDCYNTEEKEEEEE